MALPSAAAKALSSQWLGLSRQLLAQFYEVDREGRRVDEKITVEAPLQDANLEAALNWQSPFEHSGPETKAPFLMAMLQAGMIQPAVDAVGAGDRSGSPEGSSLLKKFEGRTGITKLNSTQVFAGMPPARIQVTALFRAWADTKQEVRDPVDQLWQWALPVKLAEDSTLVSRGIELLGKAIAGQGNLDDAIRGLLPSQAPVMIAMTYKGRTYKPLVIEAIGEPIGNPVTKDGGYAELAIPLTLCTLTALDRNDWMAMRNR